MTQRQKELAIIIPIVTIIIAICLSAGMFALNKRDEFNKIVEPIIMESAAAGWDMQVFGKYTSRDLKDWFTQNGEDVLTEYKKFGPLQSFHGIGNFNIQSTQASFDATADFANSPAYIKIDMVKDDELWLINSIYLSAVSE